MEQTVPDQAYNLPDPENVQLLEIEPRLATRDDFDGWHMVVQKHLEDLNLQDLIDKNIERPMRNDPKAVRWVTLSKRVSAWLAAGIEAKLLQEIHRRKFKYWADEFMSEVVKHLKGEGLVTCVKATMRIFETRQEEFNSPKEYLDSIRSQYKLVKHLIPQFPPYQTLMIIYWRLSTVPELANYVELKIAEMNNVKKIEWDLTEGRLHTFIQAVYDKIEMMDLDGANSGMSAAGVPRGRFQIKKDKDRYGFVA